MIAPAIRSRVEPPAGGDVSAPEDAVAAEQRFLESIRERVAWQARAAERLRETQVRPAPPLDVLDVATLERLVASAPDAPRAREWQQFVAELRDVAAPSPRLDAQLERLVRVVLAELLEQQ